MAGISPAMTGEYKKTLVVPQFEFDRPSRTEASRHDCPMYAASRFLVLFGAACLTVVVFIWHIPRHGMGHAEQRRPLPRSCNRFSRMHVVARWPHRELHRAAEKFKLRHDPTISTTMSQNPNGAVIRRCLRECGRFATWLDICVTVWLHYW